MGRVWPFHGAELQLATEGRAGPGISRKDSGGEEVRFGVWSGLLWWWWFGK